MQEYVHNGRHERWVKDCRDLAVANRSNSSTSTELALDSRTRVGQRRPVAYTRHMWPKPVF